MPSCTIPGSCAERRAQFIDQSYRRQNLFDRPCGSKCPAGPRRNQAAPCTVTPMPPDQSTADQLWDLTAQQCVGNQRFGNVSITYPFRSLRKDKSGIFVSINIPVNHVAVLLVFQSLPVIKHHHLASFTMIKQHRSPLRITKRLQP